METKVKKAKAVAKKTSVKTNAKKEVRKGSPTFEQIQARAYQIYVENGFQGTEMENWLKAEKELK